MADVATGRALAYPLTWNAVTVTVCPTAMLTLSSVRSPPPPVAVHEPWIRRCVLSAVPVSAAVTRRKYPALPAATPLALHVPFFAMARAAAAAHGEAGSVISS